MLFNLNLPFLNFIRHHYILYEVGQKIKRAHFQASHRYMKIIYIYLIIVKYIRVAHKSLLYSNNCLQSDYIHIIIILCMYIQVLHECPNQIRCLQTTRNNSSIV